MQFSGEDGGLAVTREGTDLVRQYAKTGENEYTSAAGGKFRFVSDERGIWISADGGTVFQLIKKFGLAPAPAGCQNGQC